MNKKNIKLGLERILYFQSLIRPIKFIAKTWLTLQIFTDSLLSLGTVLFKMLMFVVNCAIK